MSTALHTSCAEAALRNEPDEAPNDAELAGSLPANLCFRGTEETVLRAETLRIDMCGMTTFARTYTAHYLVGWVLTELGAGRAVTIEGFEEAARSCGVGR